MSEFIKAVGTPRIDPATEEICADCLGTGFVTWNDPSTWAAMTTPSLESRPCHSCDGQGKTIHRPVCRFSGCRSKVKVLATLLSNKPQALCDCMMCSLHCAELESYLFEVDKATDGLKNAELRLEKLACGEMIKDDCLNCLSGDVNKALEKCNIANAKLKDFQERAVASVEIGVHGKGAKHDVWTPVAGISLQSPNKESNASIRLAPRPSDRISSGKVVGII